MFTSQTQRIPVLSPVCAGSSIPEDWQNWQIKNFRDIRAVGGVSKKERIVGIPVNGDSLKNLGIFHGDLLIVKLTNEYQSGKLSIFQTPHGRTAKFADQDFDGSIILHNKNGWSQKWQPEEVAFIGVVLRIERDL